MVERPSPSAARPDPRVDVRFAIRLALVAFVGTLALLVAAGALPMPLRNLPTKLLYLALGAWGFVRARASRAPASGAGSQGTLLPMAALALANVVASQACALLVVIPLVRLGAHVTPPAPAASDATTIGAALVVDVIAAVVGEELFHRGAVLPALRPWGDRVAVVGSAVVFAVAHVGFAAAFSWALLLGLLTGTARVKTGSILPGMVLHGVGNTLGVALSLSPAVATTMTYLLVHAPIALVLFGSALTLAVWAAIVLRVFRRLGWGSLERGAGGPPLRALASPALGALVILYVLVNVALTAAMFGRRAWRRGSVRAGRGRRPTASAGRTSGSRT